MRNFLQEIVAKKQERLNHGVDLVDRGDLVDREKRFRRHPFTLPPGSVIAEVKRASPSQGPIDMSLDPASLAREYERCGAAAISVLTEEDYFHGSLADLDAVRAAVRVPVLRKDFVIDERQIDETAGRADALLLIVRLLDAPTLARFIARCRALEIEPIVEIYDEADIETLKNVCEDLQAGQGVPAEPQGPIRRSVSGASDKLDFLLVGINNRDLKTFTVDLAHAGRLASKLPPGCVPIAFSGVGSAAEAATLRAAGLSRALVGTALVRNPDRLEGIVHEFKCDSDSIHAFSIVREDLNLRSVNGTSDKSEVPFLVNVKICGITHAEDALLAAELGFGAVGFVFYAKSPRNILSATVREITDQLPVKMAKVGIFVDENLLRTVLVAREAGLTTIQLHGHETAADADFLRTRGFHVVRVAHSAGAFASMTGPVLVEASRGALPGGNGAAWDWKVPNPRHVPFAIAGGISPANARAALAASGAAALDVSSGVETAPGVKSAATLRALARALSGLPPPASRFWR